MKPENVYFRYRRYKDVGNEWLGEIPEHWEVRKLRQLSFEITKGTTPTTLGRDFTDEGVRFVKVESISERLTLIDSMCAYIDLVTDLMMTRSRLSVDDVVVSIAGAIGRVAIVTNKDVPANTNQAVAIIRPRTNLILPLWLATFLTAPFCQRYLNESSVQSAQANLSLGSLAVTPVALPPLPEQQVITAFLEHETKKIDSLIERQQYLISLLLEKRKAIVSHAVTKGLKPNVLMQNTGVEWLGQIPEHWEINKLGSLTVRIGSGKTPSGGAEVYLPTGVLFIRSQNVYDDGLRLEDVVFIDAQTDIEMRSSRVQTGDILLNITGASIGRSCIVGSDLPPANVNQHVCIIRINSANHDRQYIAWFVRSGYAKEYFGFIQNGAARDGLNFSHVSSLKVPSPPLSEQRAIVSFLDRETAKIDRLIEKAKQSIDLMKERRSALISAAVTGKIDVRQVG